jgi:phospholipid transport system substrate-binding protein
VLREELEVTMVQALATLLMLAAVTATTPPVTPPGETVQASVGEVIAALALEDTSAYVVGARRGRRPGGEHARTEIRRIASDVFDLEEMAQRSLATHWAARTPVEQAEFVDLFTSLLERTYFERIRAYTDQTFVYRGESVDGGRASVQSRVVTNAGAETALDYRLLLRNGRWRIYDVVVDGVSVVSTFRSEFDRVIQSSSYGALIEQMRDTAAPLPPVPGRAAS